MLLFSASVPSKSRAQSAPTPVEAGLCTGGLVWLPAALLARLTTTHSGQKPVPVMLRLSPRRYPCSVPTATRPATGAHAT